MPTASFRDRFAQWFAPATCTQLARDARWLRRQGKIHAGEFLLSLVFAQWSARCLTLNAQAQGLAEPVSRQAIDQRYTPAAVTFCQAAFAHSRHQTLDWAPAQPLAQELRRHFAAVYLVDSTAFEVPASLATLFPGCGGDASPASAKVLLRYELITGRLEPLHVLPGKRSDQGLARQVVTPLRENELQLQDKGFFSAAAWQLAGAQKAFLLCPLPRGVTLWHAGPAGPEVRLDLAAAQVEWSALYCGQDPRQFGPVRVVAFRLSPASAARHRAGLREAQRKQGRTPNATALELAGWLVLVTNAPAAQLPSAALSYLYRMRWQIELIFRQCKSGLRLNVTASANPCRVQCEWWARRLAAVPGFLWHAHAGAASWQRRGCELSFEKTLGILQQWGQSLARAFLVGGEPLRTLLHELWRHLLKSARKGRQKTRTNTWDRLREVWRQPAAAAALRNHSNAVRSPACGAAFVPRAGNAPTQLPLN